MPTAALERLAARVPPARVIAASRHTAEVGRPVFPRTPFDVQIYPMSEDPRPLGPDERAAMRRSLGAAADADVLIVQVSRMDSWKGHRQLIAALALMKDVPGWRTVFVGGAQRPHEVEYVADLEARVRAAGLADRVQFTGERRDVSAIMGAADVFCQANESPEGLGIVFMEAFAASVPVVTIRFGGALDIVDDTSGILVEPGDVPGVAAALRRLVTDPALRRTMGANGRGRVLELCDPKRQIRRLNDVLRGVASATRLPA